MDLALAVGCGPSLLTKFDGFIPLVRPADVVLLGYRDLVADYSDLDVRAARSAMLGYCLEDIRKMGPAAAIGAALDRVSDNNLSAAWLHLDVDVLDDALMPSVDSRQPGGLTYEELGVMLETALRSGPVVGMELTIFDPDLDPDGYFAGELTSFLVEVFQHMFPIR